MTKMTVTYTVSEEQVKRLEELLPYCQQIKAFKNWTAEDVLQLIMEQGSTHAIDSKLDFIEKTLPGDKQKPQQVPTTGESNVTDK